MYSVWKITNIDWVALEDTPAALEDRNLSFLDEPKHVMDDDDTKDWLKAMSYKLDCIKHDLPFFEEILRQARIQEAKGEEIYITLEYS